MTIRLKPPSSFMASPRFLYHDDPLRTFRVRRRQLREEIYVSDHGPSALFPEFQDTLRNGAVVPLFQAPLYNMNDSRMAIEVIKEGGVGSLPCSSMTHARLDSELCRLRENLNEVQLRRGLNLNFYARPRTVASSSSSSSSSSPPPAFTKDYTRQHFLRFGLDEGEYVTRRAQTHSNPNFFDEKHLQLVSNFPSAFITFHFGLPDEGLIREYRRRRGHSTKVLMTVTSLAEILAVENNHWFPELIDGVVLQCPNSAGGPLGSFLTSNVTMKMMMNEMIMTHEKCVNAIDLFKRIKAAGAARSMPVVLAGGFSGPEEVFEGLLWGAAGVMVGTPYLLCSESFASRPHRRALLLDLEDARHDAQDYYAPFRPPPAKLMEIKEGKHKTMLTNAYSLLPQGLDRVIVNEFLTRDVGAEGFDPALEFSRRRKEEIYALSYYSTYNLNSNEFAHMPAGKNYSESVRQMKAARLFQRVWDGGVQFTTGARAVTRWLKSGVADYLQL